MTERETDIEFDFFDEPETQEAASRERIPRRVPRRPPRPPSGIAPLVRLLALIAFTILVIVVLAFWIQSCQGESKRNSYRSYLEEIGAVGSESERLGRELNAALTESGAKPADVQERINGLAQEQEQEVARAEELDPPGPLRDAHADALEALEFRRSGLDGLADAFARAGELREPGTAGRALAEQAQRLVTSDVVWDDRFRAPAQNVLEDQDIAGVQVPDSNFVGDQRRFTAASLASIWARIQGASTGGGTAGGLRGNALVSVCCDRDGKRLSTETDNIVLASPETRFQVAVQNQREQQEVQVEVTLTIQQTPESVIERARIDVIDPDQTKVATVTVTDAVDIGRPLNMLVSVKPVEGEGTRENNQARYPVTFSTA